MYTKDKKVAPGKELRQMIKKESQRIRASGKYLLLNLSKFLQKKKRDNDN